MLNILITGASGFVGQNLTKYLKNYNLITLSRNNGFNYNNIDSNYLNENNVDAIIHLAGKAHDLKKKSCDIEYYEVNTNLTKSLFEAFKTSNSKIFIYLSSVKAVKDYFDYPLTEDTNATPSSIYGKSKLAAEEFILSKNIDKKKEEYKNR